MSLRLSLPVCGPAAYGNFTSVPDNPSVDALSFGIDWSGAPGPIDVGEHVVGIMHMPCRLRALGRAAINRASAVWLIVLTALPFTAPFASVDVADLWGSGHTQPAITMVSAAGVCSSQPNDTADDVTMTDGCGQHLLPTARGARTLVTSPTILPATVPAAYVPPVGSTPPPLHNVSTLVVTLRL